MGNLNLLAYQNKLSGVNLILMIECYSLLSNLMTCKLQPHKLVNMQVSRFMNSSTITSPSALSNTNVDVVSAFYTQSGNLSTCLSWLIELFLSLFCSYWSSSSPLIIAMIKSSRFIMSITKFLRSSLDSVKDLINLSLILDVIDIKISQIFSSVFWFYAELVSF